MCIRDSAQLGLCPVDCYNGPYGPIGEWDVSRITDMSGMFTRATSFNGDISKWDVSRVTDMNRMFSNARVFNGDLSKWDVSNVEDMYGMFYKAAVFNSDISQWDVSSVKDMYGMFYEAVAFNSDISKWDVSEVQNMSGMFLTAKAFNVDLSRWDVSKVTSMDLMFTGATFFKEKSKNLCGPAWSKSKASKILMFGGAAKSMSEILCLETTLGATQTSYHVTRVPGLSPGPTNVARELATNRPITERELIVRKPISTPTGTSAFTSTTLSKITCPKCGTFAKSGQFSCCAPAGAWYKNCGGAETKNINHRWYEGVESCKRKSEVYDMQLCTPLSSAPLS